MKPITIILWVQFTLGLIGAFLAFGDMHMAAMGRAWSHGMRTDFERVRQSPEYREPPAVRGYTLERFIDSMEADARRRGRIAFRAFLGSATTSLFAVVLLFLFRRAPREHTNAT